MTADEALREMREIAPVDVWKRPASALTAWADAIEAELKAKDAEMARLTRELNRVHDEKLKGQALLIEALRGKL